MEILMLSFLGLMALLAIERVEYAPTRPSRPATIIVAPRLAICRAAAEVALPNEVQKYFEQAA